MPETVVKKSLKPVAPKKDMIEEIRGLTDDEYEKSCRDAENDWDARVETQNNKDKLTLFMARC